jgi:hypothetical protein
MKPHGHRVWSVDECVIKYREAASLALLGGLTLHERERIAYASGDRALHGLILAAELGAEDAAADYIEEVDNDTALLADAKETAAKLDAAQTEITRLLREQAKQRRLADAVRFVLKPFTLNTYGRRNGTIQKPPKWAQHLIATIARLEKQP